MRACTSACACLWRVCMHSGHCFGHHACAGVYVRRVLWTSAYTFGNTFATGCTYALMHVKFVCSALGERGWGGSTNPWTQLLLGVGGYFDRRKDRGVVCVLSILKRAEVYVGVCVYIRTHTHTLHRWGIWMWAQGSGWDTWKAQKVQMD